MASGLVYNLTPQSIWEDLHDMYNKIDDSHIFQLHRDIYHVTQGTSFVTANYGSLKILWDELAVIDDLILICEEDVVLLARSKEIQKMIQFLLGLDDTYSSVRTNLLMRQPLPNLNVAYSILFQ